MSETEARATNVIEALTRVMRDLPGIGKGGKADPKQGGYAYRGIEQITPHTQELFARHGVVFTPHVRSFEIRDIVVAGKPWMDVIEQIEYTVYGPGGVDDHITVGPIVAIGRDNSDKGSNKCLTQAYKYALLQALSISDPKDDADGQTHEADQRVARPVDRRISQANADALRMRCEERGLDAAKVVKLGTDGRTDDPAEVHKDEVKAVKQAMDAMTERQDDLDGDTDAQQQAYTSDDPERPFTEGEIQPPYPDPETGEKF